jgi:O-methyltransferase domain/Dimerisation domain
MPENSHTGQSTEVPPQGVLLRMLTGYWTSQALYVAARLRIADLLAEGPRGSAELAQATGTHERALYRLLRALASEGVFVEGPDGCFGLTPLAACLRSDVPGSQWASAVMAGEEHFRAWADLLHSVRTGQTAFEHVYGKPIFDYLAEHPDQAQVFDAAMTGIHGAETQAMLAAYDFAPFHTLVDVGGGNGSVLSAVLQRYPALHGVLFDRPHVVERARANLTAAGVAARCRTVGGSFFTSVPEGGDAYLMRHILHDWDDAQALSILRACRQAMAATARLLVVECVIPPGNEPFFGKFLDVNMLAIPGGLERTAAEYRDLFAAGGFRLARIVPTRLEVSVLEGEPS